MAGDWIKIEKSTARKPEVIALAEALSIHPDHAFGLCVRFWSWCDDHIENGHARGMTKTGVDLSIGFSGLADALEKVGWLRDRNGALEVPRFDRHNSQSAKSRSITNRTVAKFREREKGNPVKQVFPRGLKQRVKTRDGHTCVYCGRKEGEYYPPETKGDAYMCLDHVIPESRGGETSESNLVCACAKCNRSKSNRTPDEAGMKWPEVTKTLQKHYKDYYQRREEKSIIKATPLNTPQPPKGAECAPAGESGYDGLPGFRRFWDAYPARGGVRQGKAEAAKVWQRAKLERHADKIVAHVEAMAKTEDWRKDQGRFVPQARTYLNQRRWEDEIDPTAAMPSDHRNYATRPAQRNAIEPDYSSEAF